MLEVLDYIYDPRSPSVHIINDWMQYYIGQTDVILYIYNSICNILITFYNVTRYTSHPYPAYPIDRMHLHTNTLQHQYARYIWHPNGSFARYDQIPESALFFIPG